MRNYIARGIAITIIMLSLTVTAYGKEDNINGNTIIIYNVIDQEVEVEYVDIYLDEKDCIETQIKKVFENIIAFNYNENQIRLLDEGTKVDRVINNDGYLSIYFSEELLNYNGTTWEYYMIQQILDNVFSFDNINTVSIYANNCSMFNEGGQVIDYTLENYLKDYLEEGERYNGETE